MNLPKSLVLLDEYTSELMENLYLVHNSNIYLFYIEDSTLLLAKLIISLSMVILEITDRFSLIDIDLINFVNSVTTEYGMVFSIQKTISLVSS